MGEGWLPPQAPGGRPPPRFEMVAPEQVPVPAARPEPVAAPVQLAAAAPRAPATTNGLALTALILGILGIALVLVTFGLGFILAIPCSVAACLCGSRARARIDLGQAEGGRGQANAGYALGVAGVVIGVAAAVGWIVWLASGGDLDQLQHDLERYGESHTRDAAIQAVLALFAR
jgi:hypothetical protein